MTCYYEDMADKLHRKFAKDYETDEFKYMPQKEIDDYIDEDIDNFVDFLVDLFNKHLEKEK